MFWSCSEDEREKTTVYLHGKRDVSVKLAVLHDNIYIPETKFSRVPNPDGEYEIV